MCATEINFMNEMVNTRRLEITFTKKVSYEQWNLYDTHDALFNAKQKKNHETHEYLNPNNGLNIKKKKIKKILKKKQKKEKNCLIYKLT